MRGNRWYLIGIAVIALAAVVYSVRSNGQPKQTDAPVRGRGAAPVVVATAQQQSFAINLNTIGSVQAFATVAVKSRVDGQLVSAHFKDGQTVKKGDRLFSIDARPFEASLRQAEAALARDRAQLVKTGEDLKRYGELVQKEYSSRQKYEEAKANYAAAQATVHANEAMVENAKLNLEYTQILSPIDGRTGSLMINTGNLVKANDGNPIVVINQTHPIYVQFSVAEKYLPEIRRRIAEGPLAVSAVIPAEPDKPEKGTVSFINNTVDMQSGTILLKATYENANDRLTPGQFVNVTLTLSTIQDAVVIPSQAVQTNLDGNYVFVVKPDMMVDQRLVTVGPAGDGQTVIAKGLNAGERVVTEGQLRLFAGARVDIRQSANSPPGGGATAERGKSS
jgi:membrane fusion protein, multidrug efflux system